MLFRAGKRANTQTWHSIEFYTIDRSQPSIVRDSLSLDSTKNDTFYYQIDRTILRANYPEYVLENITIKEINSKIYASGYGINYHYKDVLIYDFSLPVGDSFYIKDVYRNDSLKVAITAKENGSLLDGTLYEKIKVSTDLAYSNLDFIASEIGSTSGFIGPLDILTVYNGRYGRSVLLAACRHDTLLYSDSFNNSWGDFNQWCNADSLLQLLPSSIATTRSKAAKVYPNPANTTIHLEGIAQKAEYTITNLLGESVSQGFYNQAIDVSFLPQGVYVVQLQTKGTFYYAKFMKQ